MAQLSPGLPISRPKIRMSQNSWFLFPTRHPHFMLKLSQGIKRELYEYGSKVKSTVFETLSLSYLSL